MAPVHTANLRLKGEQSESQRKEKKFKNRCNDAVWRRTPGELRRKLATLTWLLSLWASRLMFVDTNSVPVFYNLCPTARLLGRNKTVEKTSDPMTRIVRGMRLELIIHAPVLDKHLHRRWQQLFAANDQLDE